MSELDYPQDLRYTAEHEWVRSGDDGTVRIGITSFAQDALGDVVYVSLPAVGDTVTRGRRLRRGRVDQVGQRPLRPARRRGDGGQRGPRRARPSWSTPTPTARAGCTSCARPTRLPWTACSTPRHTVTPRLTDGRRPSVRTVCAPRLTPPKVCTLHERDLTTAAERSDRMNGSEPRRAGVLDPPEPTTMRLPEHRPGARRSSHAHEAEHVAQPGRPGHGRRAASRDRPAGRPPRPQHRCAVPARRRRGQLRSSPRQRHLPRRRDGLPQARDLPPRGRDLRRPRRRLAQRHLRQPASGSTRSPCRPATRSRSASSASCSTPERPDRKPRARWTVAVSPRRAPVDDDRCGARCAVRGLPRRHRSPRSGSSRRRGWSHPARTGPATAPTPRPTSTGCATSSPPSATTSGRSR